MDVQIQSNETNNKHNKTYLEKVSKNSENRDKRHLIIYLFIYLILKAI